MLFVDGEDFISASIEVEFPESNDAQVQCANFTIIDDDIAESEELFDVILTTQSPGVDLGVPTVAFVTIIDNDGMTWDQCV